MIEQEIVTLFYRLYLQDLNIYLNFINFMNSIFIHLFKYPEYQLPYCYYSKFNSLSKNQSHLKI